VIKKTGKLEQQISDFMDGELDQDSTDRFVNQLKQNPDAHKTWQRYHLMGDAMRNQLPATLDIDLSQRIRQSLEKEPTIFAPESANVSNTPNDGVNQSGSVVAVGQRSAYKVGLAMAATVAFAAVFGLQMLPVGQPFENEVPLVKNMSASPGVSVVSAPPLSHPLEYQPSTAVRIESFASLGEWKRLEQSPVPPQLEMSPYFERYQQQHAMAPVANGEARVVDFENQ